MYLPPKRIATYPMIRIIEKKIARAALRNLRSGEITQGASTLTMQLARHLFLTQERTWRRKIEEAFQLLTDPARRHHRHVTRRERLLSRHGSARAHALEA